MPLSRTTIRVMGVLFGVLSIDACAPSLEHAPAASLSVTPATMPAAFDDGGTAPAGDADTTRAWRRFFTEPALVQLIDSALHTNQELAILLQEIEIARNEARARSGEYLPSIGVSVGAGVEKVARYTRDGAVEHAVEIRPERENPEPLRDFRVAAAMSWETDIWKRLRNSTRAATLRYLATTEGRNFMVSHLVAEVARTYYELVSLDRRLSLIGETIGVQERALEVVRLQKQAGRANELAVRRFEAEVQKNRGRLAETQQSVTSTQNRLNLLVGRFPEPVTRTAAAFDSLAMPSVVAGPPATLLGDRPDIRQAELEMAAAKLDVKAARARFYPALGLRGALGTQSIELGSLATLPASALYGMAADLVAPAFNRRAIAAEYRAANARQLQALFAYQRTVLTAYAEVGTQLARIHNLDSSYVAKSRQVDALRESITLADQLFRSARGDYLEVLLTQREALESRIELVELRLQQLDARVSAFQALGGGAPPVAGSMSP
ncbi:TolC family protein [Gemmatimonas sp.]